MRSTICFVLAMIMSAAAFRAPAILKNSSNLITLLIFHIEEFSFSREFFFQDPHFKCPSLLLDLLIGRLSRHLPCQVTLLSFVHQHILINHSCRRWSKDSFCRIWPSFPCCVSCGHLLSSRIKYFQSIDRKHCQPPVRSRYSIGSYLMGNACCCLDPKGK